LAYADLNADGGSVVNALPTASTSTIGGLSFAWTDGVVVPDGITLDAATGALGGSSYRVAPFDVSVIVTDALGQSTTAAFQIDQVLVFEYQPDAFDFSGIGPVVNGDRVFVNDVVAFTGVGGAVASMPYDLAFAITSVDGTPYPDEDDRTIVDAWDENNAQGTISRVTPVVDADGTTYVLEVTLTADSDSAVATVTLTYVP
ncbi:MAG: putative Ig domain-containing protein, partial [Trueperaceae bacterium]